VGSRRLTAWAVTRPSHTIRVDVYFSAVSDGDRRKHQTASVYGGT
jgi:hypothetical protein